MCTQVFKSYVCIFEILTGVWTPKFCWKIGNPVPQMPGLAQHYNQLTKVTKTQNCAEHILAGPFSKSALLAHLVVWGLEGEIAETHLHA